jgi:hypothetical protein
VWLPVGSCVWRDCRIVIGLGLVAGRWLRTRVVAEWSCIDQINLT